MFTATPQSRIKVATASISVELLPDDNETGMFV